MDQLTCKYCNKPVKSKSGLTNHEKICPSREGADMSVTSSQTVDTRPTSYYPDPMERTDRAPERKNNGPKPSKPNPFQFGAFLVMADYVPILLDVDFCIALGDHILTNGSPNSAIMAFAHQLKKLDAESD